MIDPHGEYSAAFSRRRADLDVDNLQMPYWLMNFEEHCEVYADHAAATSGRRDADILAKCLLAGAHQEPAGRKHRQDHRRFADPLPAVRPRPTSSRTRWASSTRRPTIRALSCGSRPRSTRSRPIRATSSCSRACWSPTRWPASSPRSSACRPRASRSRSSTYRACRPTSPRSWSRCSPRLVFDYAIWVARRTAAADPARLRRSAPLRARQDENGGGQAVRKILERIAKEGRKYGVSLGLITQRPSDLAEGVLSQCGTIISMRLNNDRDQAFVKAAMPEGARGFLDAIPALRNRECIICGEGVSIPIRVASTISSGASARLRPTRASRPVARDRRRGGNRPAHRQALARPRPLID